MTYRFIECVSHDQVLEQKRTCKGICRKFRVTKPTGTGRYEPDIVEEYLAWRNHKNPQPYRNTVTRYAKFVNEGRAPGNPIEGFCEAYLTARSADYAKWALRQIEAFDHYAKTREPVTKPTGTGRYESGQGRCQICDIWLDYRGCHVKDGSPARMGSAGWYCNCCNYMVRRNPRNVEHKAKLRASYDEEGHDDPDLSYFNKRRAHMLRDLGRALARKEPKHSSDNYEYFPPTGTTRIDIEEEFGAGIDVLVRIAKTIDPPNKASMIAEFERVRHIVGRTPTKEEIEEHSELTASQYEGEFQSWEHMLERLGYDPWYRDDGATKYAQEPGHEHAASDIEPGNHSAKSLDELKDVIQGDLKDEPDMLRVFHVLDKEIARCDKKMLEKIITGMD